MKPFTGAVRALVLAVFALIFTAQAVQAGPAGRLRFGTGGGIVVDIPDDAALVPALATYATTTVPVTLRLAAPGNFTANRTYCIAPTATVKIMGASSSSRTPIGNIILCNTAKNLWFENIDFAVSTTASIKLVQGNTGVVVPENITFINSDFHGPTYDPYGNYAVTPPTLVSAFSGDFKGLIVRGSYLHDLNDAIKPTHIYGTFESSNNLFDTIYSDAHYLGGSNLLGSATIKDNFMTRFTGKGSDNGGAGPHDDAAQFNFTTTQSNQVVFRGTIQGNVVYNGASRGAPQGTFCSPNGTDNFFKEISATYNLYVADDPTGNPAGSINGNVTAPTCALNTIAANFTGNRAVRSLPGAGTSVTATKLGTEPTYVPSFSADNLAEDISGNGSIFAGPIFLVGSAANPNPGASDAYAAAFDGPFPVVGAYGSRANLLATKAAVLAAYRCKTGGVCGYLQDAYDYTTGTVDYSKARPLLPLIQYIDQPRSTVIQTPWLRVWNIASGTAISVPAGTQYQIADTDTGGGATAYTSSPGTLLQNQYVRLKATTSANYATSVPIGATIGSSIYASYLTTASSIPFVEVTNGGTAYSGMNRPANELSQDRVIVAIRSKYNVVADAQNIIGGTTGLQFQSVASHPKVQIRSSGTGSGSIITSADGDWHIDIFTIDWSSPGCVNGQALRWWRDGVEQIFNAQVSVCGNSLNPNSQFQSIVLFALTTSGMNVVNASASFLWMDWGKSSSGYTIPDFSVRANADKFLADNINLTDGSGPTGISPKVFLYGTSAAQWNAGLTNRGTAVSDIATPLVMSVLAGTYN